jgi:chromosome segregation ATPase
MNNASIVSTDLDDRIMAAFADGAKSDDVANLIQEAEAAAIATGEAAERARTRALDPTLLAADVATARHEMDSAAFRRDRLQAAVTKLGVRLRELRAEEEDSRRTTAYEAVKAKRDKLATELTDKYPAIERQLVDLFARLDANDKEVNHVNTRLPTNTERLRVAELVARGLPGLVKNGTQIERMTELLALPAFEYSALHPLAWPQSR